MDKELTVPMIWQSLAIGLGLCILFAAVWRWLLPVSYLFTSMPLAFAWIEWFDPSVGPAIAQEAGPDYGVYVTAAILILQVCFIASWYLATRFSFVAFVLRGREATSFSVAVKDLVFALLLFLITLLGPVSSFGPGNAIWVSPPILFAAAFLVFAVWRTRGLFSGG
ncbi:MAG: hypothetical protein J5I65_04230 [Aridibacter famidurans]|nr:hypothetical protein [Aridibacter famidurans]